MNRAWNLSASWRYNVITAVENISFRIHPGEIVGYLGPNGSGKSTTVKSIVGLIEPSEGEMFFQGRSIREDLPNFQRRLGYVPEEAVLYPYMSGREYLQMAGRLRSIPRRSLAAFVGVPLLLIAASASASYLPAVRAARIDPAQSLHHE